MTTTDAMQVKEALAQKKSECIKRAGSSACSAVCPECGMGPCKENDDDVYGSREPASDPVCNVRGDGIVVLSKDMERFPIALLALEEIANGGNTVYPQWRSTGPKTREQMADIARKALTAPSPAALDPRTVERCAKWHDTRARDTPDVFEAELHEVSANAIRALIGQPSGNASEGER